MKITQTIKNQAEDIFKRAYESGRTMLFEHEVYALLEAAGLKTPKFCLIRDESEITKETLVSFGREVVVKVVSPDIAHKGKLGGVRRVYTHDELFVKYVVGEMRKTVCAHFEADQAPRIQGFLLIEVINFRESLGYEIMLGMTMDRDFGPVMSLSKGGDDAEFFAKYYDPANLFLPGLERKEAEDLVQGIHIRHKYEEIGHPEYSGMIAEAVETLSALAYAFSPLCQQKPAFYLTGMDINPFVFTKNHRFIAIDGYAEFEPANNDGIRAANTEGLISVFKPKGVAVIGVSTDSEKPSLAREILELLIDFKREDIYCVNPKGGEAVYGGRRFTLYPSLEDVPEHVDMAVYSAPAEYIPDFFRRMNKRKPKAVVLIPGIPQGIAYNDFAAELDSAVPKGIRIVGPNCIGVYYGPDSTNLGVNTMFLDEERLKMACGPFSNTALLSQSGGFAITLIDRFKQVPLFKAVCSFGNKYDVKLDDLMAYFEQDEMIQVIAMYLEGFDALEGRMFFELAKNAEKPLVFYKGGKTEEGAKAALSHTAAMTGSYETLEAACRQSGVVLVDDVEMYGDVVKGFSLLAGKRFSGTRVAAVTNAGFEATIFSDEIGGMRLAKLSETTQIRLDEINTHGLAAVNSAVLDVTPMTDDVMYGAFIEALLKDENVNCMMVSAVPHVDNLKASPEHCHDTDSLANIIVKLYQKYDKPMVVSINAGDYYDAFVGIMEKAGIPVFDNVRSAARVLDTVTAWHARKG